MTALLLDTSVWLASADRQDEHDHAAAVAIIERQARREVELRLLDHTLYELGHVLIRKWRGNAEDASGFITRLLGIAGAPPLVPTASERRAALELAETHRLSYYDASYPAVAQSRRLTLVSGDRKLLDAGVAVPPADA